MRAACPSRGLAELAVGAGRRRSGDGRALVEELGNLARSGDAGASRSPARGGRRGGPHAAAGDAGRARRPSAAAGAGAARAAARRRPGRAARAAPGTGAPAARATSLTHERPTRHGHRGRAVARPRRARRRAQPAGHARLPAERARAGPRRSTTRRTSSAAPGPVLQLVTDAALEVDAVVRAACSTTPGVWSSGCAVGGTHGATPRATDLWAGDYLADVSLRRLAGAGARPAARPVRARRGPRRQPASWPAATSTGRSRRSPSGRSRRRLVRGAPTSCWSPCTSSWATGSTARRYLDRCRQMLARASAPGPHPQTLTLARQARGGPDT